MEAGVANHVWSVEEIVGLHTPIVVHAKPHLHTRNFKLTHYPEETRYCPAKIIGVHGEVITGT